ncbi:KamA family radical SAM protein [Desulfocurvus vexinensis]|uniref:KamA family radical SAM protein n=1 Tax=Desulfocurvus vexinensis TaxID=399548 RepID=UPI0004AE4276|nr:KamA family radical SAM protein [Desulfocurvus vexinensis]
MDYMSDTAQADKPPLEQAEDRPPSVPRTRDAGPLRREQALFVESRAARQYRERFHPGVDARQWSDWHWQLKNRLTGPDRFAATLGLTADEAAAFAGAAGLRLPVAVTPYYASLLYAERQASGHALGRTMLPSAGEFPTACHELADPLGEEHDSPVPGIVHRYPDRVLFLVTDFCAAYCRYCTRSRRVGRLEAKSRMTRVWDQAVAYIAAHPEVRDVLVSGGDPLMLSDAALEYILSRLTAIPHVEIVRIGTKAPMVLPQRITPRLTRMLRRYHPLLMSIHCTHPAELTPEAVQACGRLADAGIPLGSQTVLLTGVNDDARTLGDLFRGLLKARVRPYYLYLCDQAAGTTHFRTPVTRGLDIIRALRGFTSGYALPHFVVDLPGGGGKTPLCPDYVAGADGQDIVFRNWEGREYRLHDPASAAVLARSGKLS